MAVEEYTNRELYMSIDSLRELLEKELQQTNLRMADHFDVSTKQGMKIIERQDVANGRLKRGEMARAQIKGAIAIIVIIVLPALWILVEKV